VNRFQVSLHPAREGTDVRLTVNRDGALAVTWIVTPLGGLVAAMITAAAIDPSSGAVAVGILGSGVAGGLAIARALWGRSTAAVRSRAERLMDAIRSGLEEAESDEEEGPFS
jgi:hypothetical protein